ncbi:MAG: fibronectin type III domain-containing protein [Paludibacter sp.]
MNNLLYGQIGSFPYMDGGFEGQAATTTISNSLSTTAWSITSTTGGTRSIINGTGRTGTKYAQFNNTSASSTRRLQTPLTAAGIASGSYTVQFYYRTASATAPTNLYGGYYYDGATGSNTAIFPAVAGTNGTWIKATAAVSSAGTSTTSGFACVRHNTGNASTEVEDIDDFVMYAGSADTGIPDPATSPITTYPSSTSITVSWTAPGTGVDGGGYMVVRGTADPATTPNTNGIYTIGNTVATGETVVYIGTSTNFTDLSLTTGTRYYYRIYTVDKAFNYSTALSTNTYAGAAPSITITSASSISTTGGTFNGNISSNGGVSLTERGFCYKTGSGVAITDNKTSEGATATGDYSKAFTGLSLNTQYSYKGYAINPIGTTLSGTEISFYTLAAAPGIPTLNNATSNSIDVALNTSSNPSNTQFAIIETSTGNFVQADGTLGASAVWQTAATWGTKTLSGLSPSTSFTFKVKARNGDNTETAYGTTASLSTIASDVPVLTVGTISGAFGSQCLNSTTGPNSFTISGTLLSTADVTVGALSGFTYSTTSGGTYTSSLTLTQAGGTYSQTIYVKFTPTAIQSYSGNIAVGGGGAISGNCAVTGSGINTAPTVTTTSPASSITNTTVTLSGNVSDAGCQAITARGICYGTSINPTISGSFSNETGTTGVISSNITGLTAATIYHFRAYATSSAGTSYGADATFTTLNVPTAQVTGLNFTSPVSIASTSTGFTINWTPAATA